MTALLPPVLQVRNLRFAYANEPPLFLGWSADIAAGITALRGDMGRGKSTLLRLLSGTLPVDGELILAGRRHGVDAAAYRRQVFWCDTADEDRFAPLKPAEIMVRWRDDHAHWDEAGWHAHLHAFALTPHLDKPLFALSTGSRRKVWLAAALSAGSALILLDNPTAGLDAPAIDHLRRTLAAAANDPHRATVLVDDGALDGVPLAGVIDLDRSSAQ